MAMGSHSFTCHPPTYIIHTYISTCLSYEEGQFGCGRDFVIGSVFTVLFTATCWQGHV